MNADLLAGLPWRCLATAPGEFLQPSELPVDGHWLPATVPGTASGALVAAGLPATDVDERDWWWQVDLPDQVTPESNGWLLRADGMATVADAWIADVPLLHGESMWQHHLVAVDDVPAGAKLTLRFAALAPLLAAPRPRPRWKASGVSSQAIRWWRTSMLGRIPGSGEVPVVAGPWRPVTLLPAGRLLSATWRSRLDAGDGVVEAEVLLGGDRTGDVTVSVGDVTATALPVESRNDDPPGSRRLRAELHIPNPQLWWPHTHGEPHRYPVIVAIDGRRERVGATGFRTVEADMSDGGFRLLVNGVPVFARGGLWSPCDPVNFTPRTGDVTATLTRLRDAGMNLIRVSGAAVYEDEAFFDRCDELGLLVWQDVMLTRVDPPADDCWSAQLVAEVEALAEQLARHPCTAVLCGGNEVHQQAAMLGLDADRRTVDLLERRLPGVARRSLPGVPYLPSTPYGDGLAFRVGSGVAHYFGVGAYLRPLSDLRTAGVRFAAECLAMAVPPSPAATRRWFGSGDPRSSEAWRRGLPSEPAAGRDFGEVTAHYAERLSGVDPATLDPESALDLLRATAAELMGAAFTEWRRPGSGCDGALLIALRDSLPGPGWGVVDAAGGAKTALCSLGRVLTPVALLLTDEGLDGLLAHLINDRDRPVSASLQVDCYVGNRVVDSAGCELTVPARASVSTDLETVLPGFRDLTWAYKFGSEPAYSLIAVTARLDSGKLVGRRLYRPGGTLLAAAMADRSPTGLAAEIERDDAGWWLHLQSTGLAVHVTPDLDGWEAADLGFDLVPGETRRVRLKPCHEGVQPPRGFVRALGQAPLPLS